MTAHVSMPRRVVIGILHGYKKYVSPLLPPACRYEPTCSVYMSEAVEFHGVIRGGWLGIRRLLRCHPFAKGGFDPPPLASRALGDKSPSARVAGGRSASARTSGMKKG